MPRKTTLTVLVFVALVLLPQVVPALQSFKSLNPAELPSVWDFPVPKAAKESIEASIREIKINPPKIPEPKNLTDPRHELDAFYAALLRGGSVRVLHYGDSPTTADLITADTRAMLQHEFGDGGTGFVLIARPWAWYNHRGVAMDGSGWKIDVGQVGELKDGFFGLGGATFRGSAGAEAHWTLRDGPNRKAEISYLAQPEGGTFVFDADGKELSSVDTAAETRAPAFASFDLPAGSTKFSVRVTQGSVRLFGADFRKSPKGVVYSSLGVNGANITLLTHGFNAAHWSAELNHYKPDLVVLAYGTNESGFPKFVDYTWAPELKAAVARVRAALPDASILLMSPMDRGERNKEGELDTISAMPRLVSIEADVAKEEGVAFFNTYEAMGGKGTMARWYTQEPRLVGADYIHPLPAGAKIVGELLYGALRDGYNAYKLRQLKEPRSIQASAGELDAAGQSGTPQQTLVVQQQAVQPEPQHGPKKRRKKTAETGKTKKAARGGDPR
jgi:lysophospholipase L1-like esterase